MKKADEEEKQRKEASRKRPPSAPPPQEAPDAKRVKLEDAAVSAAFLAGFDFTKLPAALVTDLIVANLQAFTDEALDELVQAYRRGRRPESAAGPPSSAAAAATVVTSVPMPVIPDASVSRPERAPSESATPASEPIRRPSRSRSRSRSRSPATPPPVKEEEPVDPLQMDIDEEELEYEPDKLNLEVASNLVIS